MTLENKEGKKKGLLKKAEEIKTGEKEKKYTPEEVSAIIENVVGKMGDKVREIKIGNEIAVKLQEKGVKINPEEKEKLEKIEAKAEQAQKNAKENIKKVNKSEKISEICDMAKEVERLKALLGEAEKIKETSLPFFPTSEKIPDKTDGDEMDKPEKFSLPSWPTAEERLEWANQSKKKRDLPPWPTAEERLEWANQSKKKRDK